MPSERVKVRMVNDTWDPIALPDFDPREGDGVDWMVNNEDLERFTAAWTEFNAAHEQLFKRGEPVVTRRHG